MTAADPRCPHCGEHRPDLIEKVSRPLWANTKAELWFCSVCGKTFLLAKVDAG